MNSRHMNPAHAIHQESVGKDAGKQYERCVDHNIKDSLSTLALTNVIG